MRLLVCDGEPADIESALSRLDAPGASVLINPQWLQPDPTEKLWIACGAPAVKMIQGAGWIPKKGGVEANRGKLFQNVQPDGWSGAINVGISVSRVGGNAQIKAMKEVAGSLRLDLAAYRELEAFAQLGTDLDKATQAQLDRGARMVELLKQPQYDPYHVTDQIISIYAGTKGFLDNVPTNKVAEFEKGMLDHFQTSAKGVWDELNESKKLTEEIEKKLVDALNNFKGGWNG